MNERSRDEKWRPIDSGRLTRERSTRGMDGFVSEIESRAALSRIGVADDVARVVLFCASDISIPMTGSTLMVDAGGWIL